MQTRRVYPLGSTDEVLIHHSNLPPSRAFPYRTPRYPPSRARPTSTMIHTAPSSPPHRCHHTARQASDVQSEWYAGA